MLSILHYAIIDYFPRIFLSSHCLSNLNRICLLYTIPEIISYCSRMYYTVPILCSFRHCRYRTLHVSCATNFSLKLRGRIDLWVSNNSLQNVQRATIFLNFQSIFSHFLFLICTATSYSAAVRSSRLQPLLAAALGVHYSLPSCVRELRNQSGYTVNRKHTPLTLDFWSILDSWIMHPRALSQAPDLLVSYLLVYLWTKCYCVSPTWLIN